MILKKHYEIKDLDLLWEVINDCQFSLFKTLRIGNVLGSVQVNFIKLITSNGLESII
jgi:hypothetical protein